MSPMKAIACAAGSETGDTAALQSAKALAMTAVDILIDREFVHEMKREFEAYKNHGFMDIPGLPPEYPPFPENFNRKLDIFNQKQKADIL